MAKTRPVIVVADRNAQARDLLRQSFTAEYDAYVSLVDDPASLMDTVLQVIPDLVIVEVCSLLDLERIRQVRSVPRLALVPIVATIAWGQEISRATVLRVGCIDCLEKPFDLAKLIETVGTNLSDQVLAPLASPE